MKLIEAKTAKEFASTLLADPILKMAVYAVLDKALEFELVRCKECKHSKLPTELTQRYGLPGTLVCHNPNSPCRHRHTLGDGYCPFGERKDDDT